MGGNMILRCIRSLVTAAGLLPAATAHAADIDVHIVAGQSNAVGGIIGFSPEPDDNAIQIYGWIGSKSTILNEGAGTIYTPVTVSATHLAPLPILGATRWGPEIQFGRQLHISGRTVAIVKMAVGGTTLNEHWSPNYHGVDLTSRLLIVMSAAKAALEQQGHSPRFASVLWMQGEGDTTAEGSADYEARLRAIVARVEWAVGHPVMWIIGRTQVLNLPAARVPYLEAVRSAQAAVADDHGALVDTDDLSRSDNMHLTPDARSELGMRAAIACIAVEC